MTKNDFIDLIHATLAQKGYTKIKITPAIFTRQADVTARDPKGCKRSFAVELVRRHGKETLDIKPSDGLAWVDRLEAFGAFMDD